MSKKYPITFAKCKDCKESAWFFGRGYEAEFILICTQCENKIEMRNLLDLNRLFDSMVPQIDGQEYNPEGR